MTVAMALTNQMQENMVRAQRRDAIHQEKFYFRKSVVPEDDEDVDEEGAGHHGSHDGSHDHEYTEMTVDAIVNGKVSRLCYTVKMCYIMSLFRPSGRVPWPDTTSQDVCEQHRHRRGYTLHYHAVPETHLQESFRYNLRYIGPPELRGPQWNPSNQDPLN